MIELKLPEETFDPLFRDIALSGILSDGKALADAIPTRPVKDIMADYRQFSSMPGFDLMAFYNTNFLPGGLPNTDFTSNTEELLENHIRKLWPILTRKADGQVAGSSLIPLPNPYVVPGGRFNEIYYWDSYFTMLGLAAEGNWELIRHMTENFAWLIREVGFIPNGNRTYFLSRSQPPFFSLMVTLLASHEGDEVLGHFYNELQTEYDFWMESGATEDGTFGHKVVLPEGLLNRYWDRLETPRSEMYADDIHLSEASKRPEKELFRHIRSACESGWDFSSRWLSDGQNLDTIHTTDILPVDLNCLLAHLETTIARAAMVQGDSARSQWFRSKAEKRKDLIERYFWDSIQGYYFDYDLKENERTSRIHAAGVFPLFLNLAGMDQGVRTLRFLQEKLLVPHGIVTTLYNTGQQWDAPNGWAPLQWMSFMAAKNYSHIELAKSIASRWTSLNEKVFKATGKMMEKYNVVDADAPGGGGEYPVQDGFGWSNGVYLAMKKYPGLNA